MKLTKDAFTIQLAIASGGLLLGGALIKIGFFVWVIVSVAFLAGLAGAIMYQKKNNDS